MNNEKQEIDPDFTEKQRNLVNQLTEDELVEIDEMLLSKATNRWRKVAMIVGLTMMEKEQRIVGIPDIFYAERIKHLVKAGILESTGNLYFMRGSEVRLSDK